VTTIAAGSTAIETATATAIEIETAGTPRSNELKALISNVSVELDDFKELRSWHNGR
jgi:hypothetical protein